MASRRFSTFLLVLKYSLYASRNSFPFHGKHITLLLVLKAKQRSRNNFIQVFTREAARKPMSFRHGMNCVFQTFFEVFWLFVFIGAMG
jgi:hypothetical protein